MAQQQHELERVASLTAEEAKELLLKQIEGEARHDSANLLKRLDAEARETAVDRAKHYITEAIQRCGAEHAIETTVSVVDLPSDDLKGRIIGREGRNIRALELATGIDLIIDDTPGAIILSGFDPYRREIAKQAIERLIADGRIHPARIEEVVQKVKEETDEAMRKEGAAVAFELGLHDLHPEILRLMGRLKYRTSYGQNVLSHSAEVARLAGIMAREVGLDAHVAVRAAFLHDIGKAIDREMEGTHLQIGIDFLRKHGESEAVVMAMAAHHMDIDWPSLEAMIVQAADAISAARPGARRDILESYVKRLEKLEGIADSFKGVSKSFALQAGREIRIMVESENVSDEEAIWLSKDIARRIESELEYPGPDQGHGHSRDARGGLREVKRLEAAPGLHRPSRISPSASSSPASAERLPAAPAWLPVGIGDDAAVVEPERNRLEVLSVDALVDGVHFDRAFTPPAAIGHRALAVNLSDLAAMGATPRLALLSLALPESLPMTDFGEMMDSLIALAARSRIAIAGGNLTQIDGPLVIDITVVGTVKRRQVLTRAGARARRRVVRQRDGRIRNGRAAETAMDKALSASGRH